MNTLLNSSQVRENISMVRLLKNLGFTPAKRVGSDLFYVSMLDEGDVPYSFVVNEDSNLWYDHSFCQGGDAVDFAVLFWKPVTHQDAIIKIQIALGLPGSEIVNNNDKSRTGAGGKTNTVFQIESINEIGTTDALTNYLKRQILGEEFSGDLKEVFYSKKGTGGETDESMRTYFGVAWQNECGGWEIRNKYFRTVVGHKGVTFIPRSPESLIVFSDYFSYLTWKGGLNFPQEESVLVLNHHDLIHAGLAIAQKFKWFQLYLDRSQAGFKATRIFCQHFPRAMDRSTGYPGQLNLHASLLSMVRRNVPDAL